MNVERIERSCRGVKQMSCQAISVTALLLATILSVSANPVLAADCSDYPFTSGINVEDVGGGTKIIATASVPVTFDDIGVVQDAREEATLEAKSLISGFLSEGIRSDQIIAKAVQETKSMQGETKDATRREMVGRIKNLVYSTQALLKGAVPLGECYTKLRELRVSVGIKPETISKAGNLSKELSRASNAETTTADGKAKRQPNDSKTEGFNRSEGVKSF
jgi:phosphoribosyl-ATP pyrophosphohydrolase